MYKTLLVLFVLLETLTPNVSNSKVKDRFLNVPKHIFRVAWTMKYSNSMGYVNPINLILEYGKGVNVSLLGVDTISAGKCDSSGKYDGYIGLVQRSEVESMLIPVRMDTTPHEPGKFLNYKPGESSPRIYSLSESPGQNMTLDILYLYTNFSDEIWYYYVLALFVCSTICVYFHCAMTQKSLSISSSIKFLLKIWWDFFMLLLNLAPSNVSEFKCIEIIWAFVVLAMFYGIHIILMNTLSVDLAVRMPSSSIESLQDLLDNEKFSHVKPIITTAIGMEQILSRSLPGSLEEKLYSKLKSPDGMILNADQAFDYTSLQRNATAMAILSGFNNQFLHGKLAFIEDSGVVDMSWKHSLCHIFPDIISTIKRTKESISPGLQALLVSDEVHPNVVELVQYRVQQWIELGMLEPFSRNTLSRYLTKLLGFDLNAKGYACQAAFLKEKAFEGIEQDFPEPFPISFFQRLLYICGGIFFISFMCLNYEHLHFAAKKLLKRPNNLAM